MVLRGLRRSSRRERHGSMGGVWSKFWRQGREGEGFPAAGRKMAARMVARIARLVDRVRAVHSKAGASASPLGSGPPLRWRTGARRVWRSLAGVRVVAHGGPASAARYSLTPLHSDRRVGGGANVMASGAARTMVSLECSRFAARAPAIEAADATLTGLEGPRASLG